MRSPPEHVKMQEVADVVGRHWGLDVERLDYLPEGAGAYHWVAQSTDARRWFVTCDDLDTKPWLGSDRDAVFAGLLSAYRTAVELRANAGLGFVVAAVPSVSADPAVRLDNRHSVSVCPFVEGRPGRWGQPIDPGGRSQLIAMLADLHASTVAESVPRRGLELPGRRQLETDLDELDRPWGGGPLADLARAELAAHSDVVAGWLSLFDEMASELDRSEFEPVITHGEPHPGNLIRAGDGFVLVDWDTVAVSRRERDLWMLDEGTGEVRTAYQELTGRALNPDALAAYRLLWALADVAAFTSELRGPHQQNVDSEHALAALAALLTGQEPSPYGSRTV